MDLTTNSKLSVSLSLLLTIVASIVLYFESHSVVLPVNSITALIVANFKAAASNIVKSFTVIMDLLVDSTITIAVMLPIITVVIFISFVLPSKLDYLLQPLPITTITANCATIFIA